MAREVKIRIDDRRLIEVTLDALGAERGQHLHVTNVYFKQPPGEVLKMSQDETGDFLVQLRAGDGGFELIANEPIADVQATWSDLAKRFGERSRLSKEEISYAIPGKDYSVIVTMIPNVGDFLIIQGEDPTADIALRDFGIVDPVVIDVPFDELPTREDPMAAGMAAVDVPEVEDSPGDQG